MGLKNDLRLGQLGAAVGAEAVVQRLVALALAARLERVEHHVALLALGRPERVEDVDAGAVGVVAVDDEVVAGAVFTPDLHDRDPLLRVLPAVGDGKPEPGLLIILLVAGRAVDREVIPTGACDDVPLVHLGGHKGLLSFCAFQGKCTNLRTPTIGATCHKGQELTEYIISS